MPTARWGLGVAGPSNGKLYAVGGARSSVMSTVEEYDPATNAWAGKAGMPTARDYLGVVAASDKVYAIGGYRYDGSPHFLGTTEQYDPATNTWSAKASLSIGRFGLAVALGSNGKVYAVGGMSSNSSYTALLDEYDPATDTWTRKRSMSFARSELGLAATSDGKLYAIGGYNTSSGFVGMVEEYDIQSDSWTRKRDMPTARTGIGVVAAYGKIYAIGGYGAGGYLATVEEYDPQTDTWRTQTSLGTGRWYLGAAVAASGKIYAIGGYQNDYFSPLSAVEEGFLQEPATPTPTLTPTVTSTPTSTATPTVTPTATPTATPTQPIAMYFLPAQVETRVGQVVTAELWVNTGSQAIASIDASLDFESAYLEVVDASGNPASANVFIPGVTLPVVNFNQADNTNGGATFSAGIAMGGSPAGGEFRLAAVRLRARAANATGAAVRYHWTDDPNDPRNTIVADLDGNLLEATFQPLAVRISGANLAGTVQLQGRGSAPSSRWAVPLTVTLSLTGTVSPAYVFTPTADTSGRFTVTGIAPGTYDVRVKKA
ncbi:MAG: hypothetical protein HY718_05045, partial [Planctomycetes bacterium]|nr:hypothetical protein [Planctomycetota bacterium]